MDESLVSWERTESLFSKTSTPVQRVETVVRYVSQALMNRCDKLVLQDEMCFETLTYFSWFDDN